jgi:porphobilinogen synthase
MTASFPAIRLRRTRIAPWSRALVAEHRLTSADLIWPLFVTSGSDVEEPIATLPGVSRWSVDRIAARAREARDLGIPCIALFPNTPRDLRSDDAREALNGDNLMCRAIREVKAAVPEVGILTDVALDPYTSHGHDGIVDAAGYVVNDVTSDLLVAQAIAQADAGSDIVAPSDMMDGRVAAIRAALESGGHHNVQIMAYAAKYASAFYGPFRDAVGSRGLLKGDKRGYQMDPANAEEALREVALDLAEGADTVMVKPGLPYLDIVRRVKERFEVPVFAYQVSGEYAMIEAAVAAGAGDRDALVLETLLAFKRAGCSGVLTYHAPHRSRRPARPPRPAGSCRSQGRHCCCRSAIGPTRRRPPGPARAPHRSRRAPAARRSTPPTPRQRAGRRIAPCTIARPPWQRPHPPAPPVRRERRPAHPAPDRPPRPPAARGRRFPPHCVRSAAAPATDSRWVRRTPPGAEAGEAGRGCEPCPLLEPEAAEMKRARTLRNRVAPAAAPDYVACQRTHSSAG